MCVLLKRVQSFGVACVVNNLEVAHLDIHLIMVELGQVPKLLLLQHDRKDGV